MITIPIPPNPTRCYDNTKISAYKVCPRSYFLRHVMHWRSEGTGTALVFGLSWHDGQDIVWEYAKKVDQPTLAELAFERFKNTWEQNGLPVQMNLEEQAQFAPRTPGIAYEMFYEYTQTRWKMLQEADVLAIEQPVAVPMPEMDGVWYIGRLDKVVRWNIQRLVLEHKTTTAYATIGNFRSDYVDSWDMSSQVTGYQFMGNMYYEGVDGVWIDAALVHKKIHNAYKFIPINHSFTIMKEWLSNTQRWIEQIISEETAYKEAGELTPGMFRKNEESCYGKYGACPFVNICRTISEPDKLETVPYGYVHEKWEPFSILGFEKLAKGESNV